MLMRAVAAILVVPALAGCMLDQGQACHDVADLAPSDPLPLLPWWDRSNDDVAHAFAQALGVVITGPAEEAGTPPASRWPTTDGRIWASPASLPRSITYITSGQWTAWNGSELEHDLDALASKLVGQETFALAQADSRSGADVATSSWRVLEQQAGEVGLGVRLSLEVHVQGESSFQQIRWDETRDTAGMGPLLNDAELRQTAEAHLLCGGHTGVHADEPEPRTRSDDGRFFRTVTVNFDEVCNTDHATVALDLRTGWSRTETDRHAVCPT